MTTFISECSLCTDVLFILQFTFVKIQVCVYVVVVNCTLNRLYIMLQIRKAFCSFRFKYNTYLTNTYLFFQLLLSVVNFAGSIPDYSAPAQ